MSIIDERRKKLQELERNKYASTKTTSSTAAIGGSSSRRNQLNALNAERAKTVASSLSSRVDTWLNNHNAYLNNYNSRFENRKGTLADSYVSDSGDWLETITTQKSNFDKEAQSIMSLLDTYGEYLGSDYTDSVRNALKSAQAQQDSILKNASSDRDFWSQFADENEYSVAQQDYLKQQRYEGYKNKYSGKSYEEIMRAAGSMIGDEEKEWLNSNKYNLLSTAEDFADRSAAGWETYLADEEKKAQATAKAQEEEKWYEKIARWYGNAGYSDTTLPMGNSGQIIDNLRNDTSSSYPSSSWSDEQRNIYGYLYSTDKTEAYNSFLCLCWCQLLLNSLCSTLHCNLCTVRVSECSTECIVDDDRNNQ